MAGGRPSKLDASTQQVICAAIARGVGYEPAARLAGISYSTLREWVKRAEAEQERRKQPGAKPRRSEQPYLEFLDALQRAEAEGENTNADIVGEAARGGQTVTKTERYQKRVWDSKQSAFVAVEETETIKIETTLPDWRAAAFVLERRHPDRWGRQVKTELSGPGGQPVPIQITNIEAVAPAAGGPDNDGDSE